MLRNGLLLACMAALVGCDKPFTETSTSSPPTFDTCNQDIYLPAGLFPLAVERLVAPAPPYEITHISAMLYSAEGAFSGRDCTPAEGLHVVVWPADGDAPTVGVNGDGVTFDLDPLAEAFVTAASTGDGYTLGTVALEPPILVETEGDLWIGMDAEGDSGSGPGACLGGCAAGGDQLWRATSPDFEWTATEGVALFQLTFAHD